MELDKSNIEERTKAATDRNRRKETIEYGGYTYEFIVEEIPAKEKTKIMEKCAGAEFRKKLASGRYEEDELNPYKYTTVTDVTTELFKEMIVDANVKNPQSWVDNITDDELISKIRQDIIGGDIVEKGN